MVTDYPWDGRITIRVQPEKAGPFTLWLRRPGWCDKARLRLNGESIEPDSVADHGICACTGRRGLQDEIQLELEMPVQQMVAHPNIKDCQGKVALQRGPIVYGFEALDNGGSTNVTLGKAVFEVEHRPDFLGGVTVIKGRGANGEPVLAIPFYALANRGKSSQEVWVAEKDLKPDSSWWLSRLYRPLGRAASGR